MLPKIERCWSVGIRMLLRRRKCTVWRSSDYMGWNDCFKEERAAVTVQARGIVCHTPPSRGKSTIMVSWSFQRELLYYRGRFCRRIIIFRSCKLGAFECELPVITASFPSWIRIRERSRGIFGGYYGFCSPFLARRATPFRSVRRILFLVIGRFFNLPLLSHHCPCNPALVPRFGARAHEIEISAIDFPKLFGWGLWINAHARIYAPIRITDTRLVLSLK